MSHDVINNTITKHPYEKRTSRTTAELLSEIPALLQIVGIIYCVHEGAGDIQSELKTLPIVIVHVVKDLFSHSKGKEEFETEEYKELHQVHTLELHSLEIIVINSLDLERFFFEETEIE